MFLANGAAADNNNRNYLILPVLVSARCHPELDGLQSSTTTTTTASVGILPQATMAPPPPSTLPGSKTSRKLERRGRAKRREQPLAVNFTPQSSSTTNHTTAAADQGNASEDNSTPSQPTGVVQRNHHVRHAEDDVLAICCHSAYAKLPLQVTPTCAGCDLYAAEGVTIDAYSNGAVSTDISLVSMPKGCYGRIAARSDKLSPTV